MSNKSFQSKLEAADAAFKKRESEHAKEDLELMIPIAEAIMAAANQAMIMAREAVEALDSRLPMVAEMKQSHQVMSHTLGRRYAECKARLAELNQDEPSNDETAPAAEEDISE